MDAGLDSSVDWDAWDAGSDPVPDEPLVDAGDGGVSDAAVDDGGSGDAADQGADQGGADPGADEDQPVCDPETCDGCCSPEPACLSGSDDQACGFGGAPCLDCTSLGMVCQGQMCVNPNRLPNGLVDDSQIHLSDPVSAMHMRRNLLRFLYKEQPFPPPVFPQVVEDVGSPVGALSDLARVDRLEIDMEGEYTSSAHLFHPQTPIDRVMIFHQGHSNTLAENGGLETIQYFLTKGYHVVALCMPLFCGNTGPAGITTHDQMLESIDPLLPYHPMKFFVEPVFIAINQLRATMMFEDMSMIGISGGGWTTTLVSALEPTLMNNFPVSGSLPLYMREGADIGDAEQTLEAFYQIAGYLDLYTLGSYGCRRRYVQVLNRYDDSCFAGTRYQEFEATIQAMQSPLATTGSYHVFLDESHGSHRISLHALETSIIHELDQDRIEIVDDIWPAYGKFTAQGDWTAWDYQSAAPGFGGDLLTAPAGAGEAVASWTFEVIPGTYQVAATWLEHDNRASNARFVIVTDPQEIVLVDQRQAPVGFQDAGATWQDLGLFDVSGTTLTVVLSNLADGTVVADAIRIQPFDL